MLSFKNLVSATLTIAVIGGFIGFQNGCITLLNLTLMCIVFVFDEKLMNEIQKLDGQLFGDDASSQQSASEHP